MGFSSGKPVQLPTPAGADEGQFLKCMRKLHAQEEVDDEVTLRKLELCSRPLSSLASGSSSSGDMKENNLGAWLRHDYLKATVVSNSGKAEVYVFEKLAELQCGVLPGTKVNVTTYKAVKSEEVRLTIPLMDLKLTARALYDSLINGAYEYDLFTLNCWHYGNGKAKEVIQLLQKKYPNLYKDYFVSAIASLEAKERPSVGDYFRLIFKPQSERNEETWRKVENSCKGIPWAELAARILRVGRFTNICSLA